MSAVVFVRKTAKMKPIYSPALINTCFTVVLPTLQKDLTFSFPSNPKSSPLSHRNFSTSDNSLSSPLLLVPPEQFVKKDTAGNQKAATFRLFTPVQNKFLEFTNRRLPEEIVDARCAGSAHGWLGFVNHRERKFYLANFLSSTVSPEIEIIPLPSVQRHPRLMRFETLEDYRSFQLTRTWDQLYCKHASPIDAYKIATSSPPNEANCIVAIIRNSTDDLACCRIGDSSWTRLGSISPPGFSDIIYSKKHQLFYASCHAGQIQAWDLKNPSLPISRVIKFTYSDRYVEPPKEISRVKFVRCNYLVESPKGDILQVVRYQASVGADGSLFYPESIDSLPCFPCRTVWFAVRKIDVEKLTEEPVDCLGDAVLFLGANESFSVSTIDYPGLRPNCIYFDDDPYCIYEGCGMPYGGYDIGIFSLEDNSISSLHPFEFRKGQPAPIWVFPRP